MGRLKKWLALGAAAVGLMGIGAGPAAASHWLYQSDPTYPGYGLPLHWPVTSHSLNQRYDYNLQFLTGGTGPAADNRWLTTGHRFNNGFNYPFAYWGATLNYTLTFTQAVNQTDGTFPNTNLFVQEVSTSDPAFCDPDATVQAGCTYLWWFDSGAHIEYAWVQLNWWKESGDSLAGRETVYLHEVGHALGLGHQTVPPPADWCTTPGTEWSVMKKVPCVGAVANSHDVSQLLYEYNHSDGYNYDWDWLGAQKVRKLSVTHSTAAQSKKAGLGPWPRTVTKFANGVVRIDILKKGKIQTHWLGNRKQTPYDFMRLAKAGVVGMVVHGVDSPRDRK